MLCYGCTIIQYITKNIGLSKLLDGFVKQENNELVAFICSSIRLSVHPSVCPSTLFQLEIDAMCQL